MTTQPNPLRTYLETNPEGYKVDAYGIIRSPGRFEGESLATPYFAQVGMEGCADIDGNGWEAHELTDDDRAALTEYGAAHGESSAYTADADAFYVVAWSESGFHSGSTESVATIAAMQSSDEPTDDDESDDESTDPPDYDTDTCPLNWRKGDKLAIRAHRSDTGKGMTYPSGYVVAAEDGTSGGWDVYDAQPNGCTESFYGLSVESVQVAQPIESEEAN